MNQNYHRTKLGRLHCRTELNSTGNWLTVLFFWTKWTRKSEEHVIEALNKSWDLPTLPACINDLQPGCLPCKVNAALFSFFTKKHRNNDNLRGINSQLGAASLRTALLQGTSSAITEGYRMELLIHSPHLDFLCLSWDSNLLILSHSHCFFFFTFTLWSAWTPRVSTMKDYPPPI